MSVRTSAERLPHDLAIDRSTRLGALFDAHYQRLYRLMDPNAPYSSLTLTPVKQLGRWLSTVHYDAAEDEARVQDQARERLSGAYVRSAYEFAADFGEFVVLAPR